MQNNQLSCTDVQHGELWYTVQNLLAISNKSLFM